MIIVFHPDWRIRDRAMRKLLVTTYKKLVKTMVAKATLVIADQRTTLERKLATVEGKFLSVFYWQTKRELREKLGGIRKFESELDSFEQTARDEARERTQAWNPAPDWSTHGRVEISTGPAFRQLQHISINGWGGS